MLDIYKRINIGKRNLISYRYRKGKHRFRIILLILAISLITFSLYKIISSIRKKSPHSKNIGSLYSLYKKVELQDSTAKKKNMYKKIINRATSIIKDQPLDYTSYKIRGMTYFNLSKTEINEETREYLIDKSLVDLRKYLALKNNRGIDPQIYIYLGIIYYSKGSNYFYNSMNYFEKVYSKGIRGDWLNTYALMLLENTEYNKAITIYNELLKKTENYRYHYYLGRAYKNIKNYNNSEIQVMKVIAVLKEEDKELSDEEEFFLSESFYILGWLYLRKGENNLAKLSYEKSIEINSKSAKALYWLGKVYYIEGNKNMAREYWRKASRVDPEYEPAKRRL